MIEVTFRGRPPAPTEAFDQAQALGRQLAERHRLDACRVVVNANRRKVLTWRLGGPAPQISVHWALLPHLDDLLAVVDGTPGVWEQLRTHLPAPHLDDPQPQGAVHDLGRLMATQRAFHLPEAPDTLQITWGQWPRTPPRRSLRLGSCEAPLIRIHPVLDHPDVPSWFVGFIVFHEMLHAVHTPVVGNGRRQIHTPAFRRAEAEHPDFGRAQRWERAHVRALLRRCHAQVTGAARHRAAP